MGHGLRSLMVLGVVALEAPPVAGELMARRYRCRACSATCLVAPQGLVAAHRYTWPTVCLALALWGVRQQPATHVHRRLSPMQHVGPSVIGWPSLRRWARRYGVGSGTLRERAAAFARRLQARSPLSAVDFALDPRIFQASLQPGRGPSPSLN